MNIVFRIIALFGGLLLLLPGIAAVMTGAALWIGLPLLAVGFVVFIVSTAYWAQSEEAESA